MIQLICLFFPSFLSVWITEKIQKKDFKLKEFIYHFILYTTIINFLIFLIVYVMSNSSIDYLSEHIFTLLFTIKYLIFALCFACIFPFMFNILKNNFEFKVDVEEIKKRGRKPKQSNIVKDETKNERTKKAKTKK